MKNSMWKTSFKLTSRLLIMITVYVILSMFIDDLYIVIGTFVISVPIIVYTISKKSNYENRLEILCDADRYLYYVKSKYKNRNASIYNTYLAYALVYQGKYDESLESIRKIDHSVIESDSKLNLIYHMVLLKISYNNKDIEKYNSFLSDIKNIEQDEKYLIIDEVFDVPLYMLEERYQEAIDLMVELIPKQRRRSIILELEYYLGLAYLKEGKLEDAKAVLEFMAKKKYKIVYVKMCKKLLSEIVIPIEIETTE